MPVTRWAEVRWALVGCLRLARGDRGGLAYFDRSLDGFWRSFFAAALSYPFFLVLLTMRVSLADWNTAGGLRIILVETIGYVISWVAFPLVMLSVLRWIGREQRFFDFMVPYNWCQLPQSVLFILVGLESETGAVSDPISQMIEIAAAIAVLVYEWYIARVALETSTAAAILVVLVDLVLGVLITRAAGSLY
jgi:branched-subunit amino acid transport protein AzlD